MNLTTLMLDQLAEARSILESGDELVPTWRILTPEATYLILTRFDHDKPEQIERTLAFMGRFMIWKMALSYVLTAETWIGPETTRASEEALLVVGVSRTERLAAMQWFGRADVVTFAPVKWTAPEEIDDIYFSLLPPASASFTGDEIAELEKAFGRAGDFEATELS